MGTESRAADNNPMQSSTRVTFMLFPCDAQLRHYDITSLYVCVQDTDILKKKKQDIIATYLLEK